MSNLDVKTERVVTAARSIATGETVGESDFVTSTVQTLTCHNPKCGVEIKWRQEDLVADASAVDESFFRVLMLHRSFVDPASGDPGIYSFCSATCLIKWLEHAYVPSISPMEKRRREEALSKVKNFEKDRDSETGQYEVPEVEAIGPDIIDAEDVCPNQESATEPEKPSTSDFAS